MQLETIKSKSSGCGTALGNLVSINTTLTPLGQHLSVNEDQIKLTGVNQETLGKFLVKLNTDLNLLV